MARTQYVNVLIPLFVLEDENCWHHWLSAGRNNQLMDAGLSPLFVLHKFVTGSGQS